MKITEFVDPAAVDLKNRSSGNSVNILKPVFPNLIQVVIYAVVPDKAVRRSRGLQVVEQIKLLSRFRPYYRISALMEDQGLGFVCGRFLVDQRALESYDRY